MTARPAAEALAAELPSETYRRYATALAGRPLPQAIVDLDRFDANADAVLDRAGTTPVRIASKSVRCSALLRRLLDHDPRFAGLLCFTADEAVHLAGLGFHDLVVAYPTVDPAQLAAVAGAVDRGASITLMVDDVAHVDHLERHVPASSAPVPVAIDLDLSWDLPGLRFGVWRSPVRTAADAARLARRIVTSPRLRLDGLIGYEAQIAGVAERAPGRAAAEQATIALLKRRSLHRIARLRAAAVAAVEDVLGHPLRFVNAGGTGSLESSARERVVTEVTAGSAFFAPALFDHYDGFQHLPAAGYALPVVRRPAPGHRDLPRRGLHRVGPGGTRQGSRPVAARRAHVARTRGGRRGADPAPCATRSRPRARRSRPAPSRQGGRAVRAVRLVAGDPRGRGGGRAGDLPRGRSLLPVRPTATGARWPAGGTRRPAPARAGAEER